MAAHAAGILTMKKNENPFSVYATVSQLAFVIIAPLLLFLWGGSVLVKKFEWPDWVMIIFVFLALIFMISGAANYIMKLIKMYEKPDGRPPKAFTSSRSDNDYYDEYKDMRK